MRMVALTPLPPLVGMGWWKGQEYDLRVWKWDEHAKAGDFDLTTADPPFAPKRAIALGRPALRKFVGEADALFRVEEVRLRYDRSSEGRYWYYVVEFWSEHESLITKQITPLGEEHRMVHVPFIVYFDGTIESPRRAYIPPGASEPERASGAVVPPAAQESRRP